MNYIKYKNIYEEKIQQLKILYFDFFYQNIANHEKSQRHVNNQRKQLRDMHSREKKRKQDEKELSSEIARIEAAARVTFLQKDVLLDEHPEEVLPSSKRTRFGKLDPSL